MYIWVFLQNFNFVVQLDDKYRCGQPSISAVYWPPDRENEKNEQPDLSRLMQTFGTRKQW